MNNAWKQSRYDKGNGDDYINCPLTKEEYYDLLCDNFRSPHLWKWESESWKLRHRIFDECDILNQEETAVSWQGNT